MVWRVGSGGGLHWERGQRIQGALGPVALLRRLTFFSAIDGIATVRLAGSAPWPRAGMSTVTEDRPTSAPAASFTTASSWTEWEAPSNEESEIEGEIAAGALKSAAMLPVTEEGR